MNQLQNKNEFFSIELVDIINQFRNEENKNPILHKNVLQTIREELEEIGELNFQPAKIKHAMYKDK